MIVNGRASMAPAPAGRGGPRRRRRYRLAAQSADGYAEAGLTVVLQDIVLGGYLTEIVAAHPDPAAVRRRARPAPGGRGGTRGRRHVAGGKTAYKPGDEVPLSSMLTCGGRRRGSDYGLTPRGRCWTDD